MAVFLVETYVIKPDKLGEFTALLQEIRSVHEKTKRLVQRGEISQDFQSVDAWQLGRVCRNDGV